MADDLAPFPDLPLPPADPGEFLTHFGGWISAFRFDKDGKLVIQVTVDDTDKYLAMPLSDIRGRTFKWTVHAPRGRTPLTRRGTLGVYDARQRIRNRQADRRWRRVRKEVFDGTDD